MTMAQAMKRIFVIEVSLDEQTVLLIAQFNNNKVGRKTLPALSYCIIEQLVH